MCKHNLICNIVQSFTFMPVDSKQNKKIGCTDCEQVYIGETSKNLRPRIKEHESNNRAESQIFHYVRDPDHAIDWNAKVIAKFSNVRSRRFLETCYTLSNINSYNRSIDIPEVYLPTVSQVLNN